MHREFFFNRLNSMIYKVEDPLNQSNDGSIVKSPDMHKRLKRSPKNTL